MLSLWDKDLTEMQNEIIGRKIPQTQYSMKGGSLASFFPSSVVCNCGLVHKHQTNKQKKSKQPKPIPQNNCNSRNFRTSELKSSKFLPNRFALCRKTKTSKTSVENFTCYHYSLLLEIQIPGRIITISSQLYFSEEIETTDGKKSSSSLIKTYKVEAIWDRHTHRIPAFHISFLCNHEPPEQQRDA